MLSRDEFVGWIPFPVEPVFLFFANPENLPRLMPAALDTRIETLRLVAPRTAAVGTVPPSIPLAGAGSEIETSFLVSPLVPFRTRWIARITEFEWNHHFADMQAEGPFKSWLHRHELTPETREGVTGTIVRDRIEYDVGFGFLGRIAQNLFVRHNLRATFAHRQRVLAGLLQQAASDNSQR
jgi:ligand-binding SRPBCC domain-containing protein